MERKKKSNQHRNFERGGSGEKRIKRGDAYEYGEDYSFPGYCCQREIRNNLSS